MKRMYVVLGIMLLLFLGALTALSQPFDRQQRRMELREEMHRRMREKLLFGNGPDQDMFKDMEAAMDEAMSDSFAMPAANFASEWTENKSGRVLILTPQSPEQKLNIDVNATVITIKGESVQKTATSSVSSNFSNSFPVPGDCDGTKVKMSQKDGKLLVELPFKSAKTVQMPLKEERKPLPPLKDAVEI